MNELFLKRQSVKSDGRRRKTAYRIFLRIQQISLIVIVWLAFVGLIYGFYQLIFERRIFVVKNIEVEGESLRVKSDEIRALAGIETGTNLFSVDLAGVQKRIESNPWIKEVAVARKLPSTIWIYASEYTPYALLASDDIYMVNIDGVVFKKLGETDEKNFPVITGIDAEDVGKSIGVLKKYSESPIAEYFIPAEVHFDRRRGYSVVVSNYGMVIRMGFSDMDAKLSRLYAMLGAISSYKGKIRYVDMNIPGKVVVKYEEG